MLYRTHVQDIGWQDWVEAPRQNGTTGQGKKLEALEIQLDDIPNLGVSYSTHIENIGWTAPVVSNQVTGTTGENKAIEAIQIQLYGDEAPNYDIWYSLYVEDYGWLQWTKNGNICGTEGGGLQAEAIRIFLCKRGTVTLEVSTTWSYLKIEPPKNEPAPEPQGTNQIEAAQAVLEVARSQIGYLCNPDEGETSKYGDYFGTPGSQYCAQFVSWCGIMAGYPDAYPMIPYVPSIPQWYLESDNAYFYYYGHCFPKPGDQVFFDYNLSGDPEHTGIVESYDYPDLYTIEGNTRDPRGVYRKYYDLSDGSVASQIYGFGEPYFC